ncbi:MAG: cell division protein FtsL [Rubrivivax sp.]|nr:cell division protein FtsL [Rubrivivax sp.]
MTRINVLLLMALLASCLALVRSAYESRRVFTELDRAQREQRQLDADHTRLDAERQAQATPRLVEKVAREKLRMSTATPAITAYVEDVPANTATAPR